MKTLKKQKLSSRIADEIKNYIKSQDLRKGDNLPNTTQLMKILGVGRTSLREALQLLETQDIVEVLNGKGIFVKELKSFHIQTSIEVENEKEFLLQALEVRTAIEGKAVELASQKATFEDTEQMDLYLKEYVHYINSGQRDKANNADAMFHQTIYAAAGNELLTNIIDSVWDTFHEFWNEPFGISDIFDESYPYHQKLLNAIKENNEENAIEAFNGIMASVKSSIIKIA